MPPLPAPPGPPPVTAQPPPVDTQQPGPSTAPVVSFLGPPGVGPAPAADGDAGTLADVEDLGGDVRLDLAPQDDAAHGNRPVEGGLLWREDPCRSCHRPFEPDPPLEVYVAIGYDSTGRIVHQRYVRGREKEGGGRKRLPGDTMFVPLRDGRVTPQGLFCFGRPELYDRHMRTDEMLMGLADLRANKKTVPAIWNRKPANISKGVGKEKKAKEKPAQHEACRRRARSASAALPSARLPPHRIRESISHLGSRDVVQRVTSFQPAYFAGLRVGEVFRLAPEVRRAVFAIISAWRKATYGAGSGTCSPVRAGPRDTGESIGIVLSDGQR